MTDEDHEAVERIVRQADGLADRILAADVPNAMEHRALHGLVSLGSGAGLFTPAPRHMTALERLPEPVPIEGGAWLLPPLGAR